MSLRYITEVESGFPGFSWVSLVLIQCDGSLLFHGGKTPVQRVPAQLLGHMSADSSAINTEKYDSANLNKESVGANELRNHEID